MTGICKIAVLSRHKLMSQCGNSVGFILHCACEALSVVVCFFYSIVLLIVRYFFITLFVVECCFNIKVFIQNQ